MPPSKKKRNRNVGPSDPYEQPFPKGVRTDGGRRGIASTGGGGGGDGDGVRPSPVVPGDASSSSSSSSASIARQVCAAGVIRGRAAREKSYVLALTRLNYQLYVEAKRALGGPIPDDAFYDGLIEHYHHEIAELKRRFLRKYGDIVVFGNGDCGQLGCGYAVTEARKPKIVAGLRGVSINMVASGGLHTVALDEDGRVYSWGCNDEGSLGWQATEEMDEGALPSEVKGLHPSLYGPNGTTEDMLDSGGQIVPFERRKDASIVQVATGETQSLALSHKGDVYSWGALKDNEGRKFRNMPPQDDTRPATGNKDLANLEEDDDPKWYRPPRGNQDWPMHLTEIPGRAKAVSAGGSFNAALLEDDTVVTWGIGTCGELARPVPELTKKTSDDVVLREFLKPKPPLWEQPGLKRTVVTMSCGDFHFLIVSREQGGLNVYSSGLNNYGQLGHGDIENRKVLTKVKTLEGCDAAKVGARGHFSCFVDKTGKRLWECGRGDYGQLGITLEQPDPGYCEPLPVRVPLVYELRAGAAVANPKENCVNVDGIVEEDQPVIDQISCGTSHVLVLTKGGDAYSWGFGDRGACGQGTEESDVLRPRKIVMNKSRMQYVSGGGQHSTAIVTTTTGSVGLAS